MFQKHLLIVFASLTFALSPSGVFAEVIRVPVGEQASTQPAIDMPAKGMTKDRVKTLFGEPLEEIPGKGQPPISRWKYRDFTVYFDSNVVIHCVRNFKPNIQQAPDSQQE